MRIIHITASYKPAYLYGGPIRSVAKLCESLIENDIQTEVFTTTANGKSELEVAAGEVIIVDKVPVTYFKRLTKDHTHFSPALLWHLHKVLSQRKKQQIVIHIHAWWNLVSILSCCIAKWHHVPIVLSPRGMLTKYTFNNKNSIIKRVIHQLLGKRLINDSQIHATSLKEQADIKQFSPTKNITVISNILNLPTQIYPVERIDECFKLIFLSRIEEKKGLELLLATLTEVPINWTLTIAGSGSKSYINILKQQSNSIAHRTNWIGELTDDEKFSHLAQHDLMVLISYNENFANVVIESLSVGTPVLISNHVGLSNYVQENNLGWITTLNKEIIKNKIMEASGNINLRKKIKNTAPSLIQDQFNVSLLTKKYISLYKSSL